MCHLRRSYYSVDIKAESALQLIFVLQFFHCFQFIPPINKTGFPEAENSETERSNFQGIGLEIYAGLWLNGLAHIGNTYYDNIGLTIWSINPYEIQNMLIYLDPQGYRSTVNELSPFAAPPGYTLCVRSIRHP
jgi:hypothetical protein